MRFVLEITCNNDAFVVDLPGQVAEILRYAARTLERGRSTPLKLYDSNGNVVGNCRFELES